MQASQHAGVRCACVRACMWAPIARYTLQPSDMFPVIQGILKEKLNQNIEWRKTDDEL